MFSFCKIRGLARAFCQAGCLASANLGGLVPRRAVFSAGSSGLVPFRGEISSLIPAVGGILRVWYPQKPLRQIATRHFSGCEEPNRRSWQKSGYQTSRFAIIRGLNRTGDTKSPVLGRGVPNARSWHDGYQIPGSRRETVDCHIQNSEVLQAKKRDFQVQNSEDLLAGALLYCLAREAMAVPIMEKAAPMRTTQPKTSFPGSDASAITK